MRALEAKANPPSPAAQAIAPFFKGGWKDTALVEPFEKWSWKDVVLFTPFEKGGRHRAAMTGGFALRAPLANSAT
jgi:hypothetical protein